MFGCSRADMTDIEIVCPEIGIKAEEVAVLKLNESIIKADIAFDLGGRAEAEISGCKLEGGSVVMPVCVPASPSPRPLSRPMRQL